MVRITLCFALLALLGAPRSASADTLYWAGGLDSWTVLGDWLNYNNPPDYTALNLPTASDSVTINNGGTPQIIGANAYMNNLVIDWGSSLSVSAGSLQVSGYSEGGGGTYSNT